MSNPLKKVGKAVGKVFKTVTKVVKDNWKLIVAGAAIYFTGGAMGLWNTPFTSTAAAGGAAAGAGSGAAGAAAGAAETAAAAAAGATPGAVTGAATGAGAASGAANYSLAAGMKSNALGIASPLTSSAAGAGSSASLWGGVKGAAKAMLGFVKENPAAGLIAGNMLSNAFTPTAAEEAIKLDKHRRANSSFFGVPGTAGAGTKGSDISGLFDLTPRGEQPSQQTGSFVDFGTNAGPLAPQLPGGAAPGLIGSRMAFT